MMKRLTIVLFVCYLVITIRCTNPVETDDTGYEPQLNIFGVLSPDGKFEFVRVMPTYSIKEKIGQGSGLVEDAQVFIDDGNREVVFEYDGSGYYLDKKDELTVTSGSRYYLTVKHPQRGLVSGSTLVPDQIRILYPHEGDTLRAGQEVEVVWTRDATAGRYKFHLEHTRILINNTWVDSTETTWGGPGDFTSDTTETIYTLWGVTGFSRKGDYLLKVLAYDQNLYDYARTGNEAGAKEINHLQGGVGVFGSVTVDSLKIYVR